MVLNLFNQWQGTPSKSFFKRKCHLLLFVCSVEWVQPNSTASNENMSWYSAKSQQAASSSSGAQESNPLKSNSSNNLPCLCLAVSLGVWVLWGLSPPPATGPLEVVWAQVMLPLLWPLGFSSRWSLSKPCCSLPP